MRCRALSPECLSRQGAGPVLPSAAVSERWGQLCTPLFSLSMGINTDCDDIRAINLNTGPGNSPGPDIIMALGSNQTIYLSPLLSGSTSSDVLLPTENTAPSNNTQYIVHHNMPCLALQGGPVFCPRSQGWACVGLLVLLSLSWCWARTYFLLRSSPGLCVSLSVLLCPSWHWAETSSLLGAQDSRPLWLML